jgi:hypothetical protein
MIESPQAGNLGDPRGNEMKNVMYEWMPLHVKFICVEKGLNKILMVTKVAKK